jgi:20S proteasome subunit alpha 4
VAWRGVAWRGGPGGATQGVCARARDARALRGAAAGAAAAAAVLPRSLAPPSASPPCSSVPTPPRAPAPPPPPGAAPRPGGAAAPGPPPPPFTPSSQDDRTLHKIVRLDENISLAFAGLSADARVLINLGRLECQNFRLMVEDQPSVEYVTRVLGQTQQRYTQRGGTRPVGISTIIGGVGADGKPQLWTTDPSGVYSAWKANAVGRNSKSLLELLEKQYREGCSEAEALKLAVRALLEVVESGAKSIEVGVMRHRRPMEMVDAAQIEAIVAQITAEKEAEGAGGAAGAGAGGAAGGR